jgi:hypothetical protein
VVKVRDLDDKVVLCYSVSSVESLLSLEAGKQREDNNEKECILSLKRVKGWLILKGYSAEKEGHRFSLEPLDRLTAEDTLTFSPVRPLSDFRHVKL